MKRGQSAVEFVLISAVVLTIVAGVLFPFVKEAELSSAIAAARVAALDFASTNASLSLTSVDYAVGATNVTVYPRLFFQGAQVQPLDLRLKVLRGIAGVFNPNAVIRPDDSCVSALFYAYCVG